MRAWPVRTAPILRRAGARASCSARSRCRTPRSRRRCLTASTPPEGGRSTSRTSTATGTPRSRPASGSRSAGPPASLSTRRAAIRPPAARTSCGPRWTGPSAWPASITSTSSCCLAVTRAELPELAALGLRVLTWSSLATSYFAGRDQPSWSSPANAARRERARELAARRGVSPTAIALAYVLHQDDHVMPVIGTVSADHLGEALDAAALELTADEAGWL